MPVRPIAQSKKASSRPRNANSLVRRGLEQVQSTPNDLSGACKGYLSIDEASP